MTQKITEQRLAPDQWDAAIAETDGPQLVVAGPGAGKTEFLVRRAAHLVDGMGTPASSLLVLTFSRRAAADCRQRLGRALRHPAGAVGVSTFHSFFYRVLEPHAPGVFGWKELPSILTGPEQISLVSRLLADGPPTDWPKTFRSLLGTRTFAAEVADFILRANERLLTPDGLRELASGRADWRALPDFLLRYHRELEETGRIDYGTLQAKTVKLLEDEEVREKLADQYRYLLVDEYQDTTLAQSRLLQLLNRARGNITVAADPYQSIYEFRGADLFNTVNFADDFRPPSGEPVRRWVLDASLRVPAEILEKAVSLTAGIDLPGAAGPVKPTDHPGRVEAYAFDHPSQEPEWIAAEAVRLHLEEQIPYGRMAVLVRSKRRLLTELSRALERRSAPHNRPDTRLADHPAARIVFDMAQAAAARNPAEAAAPVRRLLLGRLFRLGVGEYRRLERRALAEDGNWAEVIRSEVPDGGALAGLLENPEWANLPAAEGFWRAWNSLPQFVPLVRDPGRGEYRAAWASLSQTLARAAERNPELTLTEYVRLADSDDFEATPLLDYRPPDQDQLVLTTLHQSKGLDFDVVFIADAVEGVLPDLRRRQSLLQVERLNPNRRDRDTAALLRLQEETRLVYTAMTRARTRVVFTATKAGDDLEQTPPSRFLLKMAHPDPLSAPDETRSGRPVTPREAETWLRAALSDIDAPAPRKLAAACVLTANPHPDLRHPDQFALVRRPGPDRGMVEDDRIFSPTDAESYATCPRRFAMERLLKVSGSAGTYADFGSLIHGVLEEADRTAGAEGRASTLQEALTVMEERFPLYDFGSGSWLQAWKKRGRALLEKYYEHLAPSEPPLLMEHKVEIELGGVDWSGRIDRVQASKNGLALIDYKTSKNLPLKAEAAASLQLGFYRLAAERDPEVRELWSRTFPSVLKPEISAAFWHPLAIKENPRQGIRNYDPGQDGEVRRNLEEAVAGTLSEDWRPQPGSHCGRCDVRIACPAWPQGKEAFSQ